MLAVAPFDLQLTDTYFVVGHFHWVLIGGTLFGIFAAIYYWFPKVTGRMLSERLGRWQFWLFVIGFILTFVPMHVAGHAGHAAADLHLRAGPGLGDLEPVTTLGVPFQAPASPIFVVNIVRVAAAGPAGRRRPVGRLDAGVGDDLAAAAPTTSRSSRRSTAAGRCGT